MGGNGGMVKAIVGFLWYPGGGRERTTSFILSVSLRCTPGACSLLEREQGMEHDRMKLGLLGVHGDKLDEGYRKAALRTGEGLL